MSSAEPPLRKACDKCTSQKTACDGLQPCSRCIKSGHVCSFSVTRKRGPQAGAVYRPRAQQKADAGDDAASHADRPDSEDASKRARASPSDDLLHVHKLLFWPQQCGPITLSTQEQAYCRSFFRQAQERSAMVHEAGFWAAVDRAKQWPGAAGTSVRPDADAVGLALLVDMVLGLGAAGVGHGKQAAAYLQRAVPRVSSVLLLPSQYGAQGLFLLTLAVSEAYGVSSPGHQSLLAATGHAIDHLMSVGAVGTAGAGSATGAQAGAIHGLRMVHRMHFTFAKHNAGERLVVPEPSFGAQTNMAAALDSISDGMVLLISEGLYGLQGRPGEEMEEIPGAAGSSSRASASSSADRGVQALATSMIRTANSVLAGLPGGTDTSSFQLSVMIAHLQARLPMSEALISSLHSALASAPEHSMGHLGALCGRLLACVQAAGLHTYFSLLAGNSLQARKQALSILHMACTYLRKAAGMGRGTELGGLLGSQPGLAASDGSAAGLTTLSALADTATDTGGHSSTSRTTAAVSAASRAGGGVSSVRPPSSPAAASGAAPQSTSSSQPGSAGHAFRWLGFGGWQDLEIYRASQAAVTDGVAVTDTVEREVQAALAALPASSNNRSSAGPVLVSPGLTSAMPAAGGVSSRAASGAGTGLSGVLEGHRLYDAHSPPPSLLLDSATGPAVPADGLPIQALDAAASPAHSYAHDGGYAFGLGAYHPSASPSFVGSAGFDGGLPAGSGPTGQTTGHGFGLGLDLPDFLGADLDLDYLL